MPCDFIARMRSKMLPCYVNHACACPNIIALHRTNEKQYIWVDVCRHKNSVGLAFISDTKNFRDVMCFGDHRKITNYVPMLLITGVGGLMTVNGTNMGMLISSNKYYSAGGELIDEKPLQKALTEKGFPAFNLSCLRIAGKNLTQGD